MALFGVIKSDDKVFTGDKIRIDFGQSFTTPDVAFSSTLSHQVSFDGGSTYIDVTAKKYIDYIYSTAGTKTITLKLKDNVTPTPNESTFTKSITVLDITLQDLFATDSDLYKFEPEIDAYLPKKWSGWNLIHLQVQEWIMDWLDESKIWDVNGAKLTVAAIVDNQQVKQLAIYKALEFIFEGNSNVVGDLFSIKRDKYKALAMQKMTRGALKLDLDGDAAASVGEGVDLFTGSLIRG